VGPGVRRVLLWVNGVCVIGLLAAGLAAVLLYEKEASYPDEWDARVVPLVQYVERERGFTFEHPVHIDFLTPTEYSERTRADEESLEAEDVEDLEQGEALLRAFGLITDDVDLLDSVNDLNDTGTVAYYDSIDETVTVRGTELTPDLRATLVHELTHTLQDQHFGLDTLYEEEDEDVTDGQYMAFRALVEGDADRIQAAYVESLGEADQALIDAGAEDAASELEDGDSPTALMALFATPYILGDAFVNLLDTVEHAKIDAAFVDPPKTEEQLLDPFAYLDGDQPRAVATPGTDGLEVLDEGDFGAAALLVVLAERIDPRQALAAATGWGGDAYAVFERDGRLCARVRVSGDTTADSDQLEAALRDWAAAAPGSTAGTTRTGDVVDLESCDPGPAATAGSGGSLDALILAGARSQIAAEAIDEGLDRNQARCFAAALVSELDAEEIQSEEPSPRSLRTATQIALRCRGA
jgi:hypothetical protein